MALNSKIEWTHHTANLWWGCTKCSIGCNNCFAEEIAERYKNNIWGYDKPRKEIKGVWHDLAWYQYLAKHAGQTHWVLVGSMMDIFEKPMPLIDHHGNKSVHESTDVLRAKFFNEVIPSSPNLNFLLLTKRPSNINKYIPNSWKTNPPENVMFGTSPVNQATFEKSTEQLIEVNGKRFLSVEPQLEKIDLGNLVGIDWIIQGGESGSNRRPFNIEWARQMRDECASLKIPYFFKQIDKLQPIPVDLQIRQYPKIA